jgi:hypothetical protein
MSDVLTVVPLYLGRGNRKWSSTCSSLAFQLGLELPLIGKMEQDETALRQLFWEGGSYTFSCICMLFCAWYQFR